MSPAPCPLAFRLSLANLKYMRRIGQSSSCPGDVFPSRQSETCRLFPNPKLREVFTRSPTVAVTKGMGHQQFPFLSEERQHLANAANLLKAFDRPATPVLLHEPFCVTVKGSYDPVDNIISSRSSVHSPPSQPSFNVCQES